MNRKGFTLIELLVVIAVIGIIASAVIEGLQLFKKKNIETGESYHSRNTPVEYHGMSDGTVQ